MAPSQKFCIRTRMVGSTEEEVPMIGRTECLSHQVTWHDKVYIRYNVGCGNGGVANLPLVV